MFRIDIAKAAARRITVGMSYLTQITRTREKLKNDEGKMQSAVSGLKEQIIKKSSARKRTII